MEASKEIVIRKQLKNIAVKAMRYQASNGTAEEIVDEIDQAIRVIDSAYGSEK